MNEQTLTIQTQIFSEQSNIYSEQSNRKFSFWAALRGDHRPRRVILHGIFYLLGFKIAVAALIVSNALANLMLALAGLGLKPAILYGIPFSIPLIYALLWVWFLVSLHRCAPNAETVEGARTTRRVSEFLGVFLAATVALVTAISLVR